MRTPSPVRGPQDYAAFVAHHSWEAAEAHKEASFAAALIRRSKLRDAAAGEGAATPVGDAPGAASALVEEELQTPRRDAVDMATVFSTVPEVRSLQGGRGGGGKAAGGGCGDSRGRVCPLPQVFFRRDFQLTSPDTFDAVTSLATPLVLQEKARSRGAAV